MAATLIVAVVLSQYPRIRALSSDVVKITATPGPTSLNTLAYGHYPRTTSTSYSRRRRRSSQYPRIRALSSDTITIQATLPHPVSLNTLAYGHYPRTKPSQTRLGREVSLNTLAYGHYPRTPPRAGQRPTYSSLNTLAYGHYPRTQCWVWCRLRLCFVSIPSHTGTILGHGGSARISLYDMVSIPSHTGTILGPDGLFLDRCLPFRSQYPRIRALSSDIAFSDGTYAWYESQYPRIRALSSDYP